MLKILPFAVSIILTGLSSSSHASEILYNFSGQFDSSSHFGPVGSSLSSALPFTTYQVRFDVNSSTQPDGRGFIAVDKFSLDLGGLIFINYPSGSPYIGFDVQSQSGGRFQQIVLNVNASGDYVPSIPGNESSSFTLSFLLLPGTIDLHAVPTIDFVTPSLDTRVYFGLNSPYGPPGPSNMSAATLIGSGATAVIAHSVTSAPEPAAWVQMITGIGAVGTVIRLRRRGSRLTTRGRSTATV